MRKSKKKELKKHLKRKKQRDQNIVINTLIERAPHIIEKAKKIKSQVNPQILMNKISTLLNHLENG